MGRVRRGIRSSRRVPPPKDSDFDHEIVLVEGSGDGDGNEMDRRPSSSRADAGPPETASGVVPSAPVHVEQPTPRHKRKKHGKPPETAIDILYENQRGLFLCGMALFSSKALGNLDPPPWTNGMHKPSPTDIGTAQVPDPSWVWQWPEWKINHDEGGDSGGWEYSFMFSKRFSWHGPTWWNSCVRRRAWIRKRVRKCVDCDGQDVYTLNPDYFSVQPRSETSCKGGSSVSLASVSSHQDEIKSDVTNVEILLAVLKVSAIDRAKIEAMDSYLQHAGDNLVHLQEKMHEIMALFVFQASRRVLLTRLTDVYERSLARFQTSGDDAALEERISHLSAAIKHADEEVRRLEYWSDVKGMAPRTVEREERRDECDATQSCP